jgi:hypothetical protein
MFGQAGETHPATFKMNEKQDVVSGEPRQVSTSTVKKSVPARTHVGGNEILPGGILAPLPARQTLRTQVGRAQT